MPMSINEMLLNAKKMSERLQKGMCLKKTSECSNMTSVLLNVLKKTVSNSIDFFTFILLENGKTESKC